MYRDAGKASLRDADFAAGTYPAANIMDSVKDPATGELIPGNLSPGKLLPANKYNFFAGIWKEWWGRSTSV